MKNWDRVGEEVIGSPAKSNRFVLGSHLTLPRILSKSIQNSWNILFTRDDRRRTEDRRTDRHIPTQQLYIVSRAERSCPEKRGLA